MLDTLGLFVAPLLGGSHLCSAMFAADADHGPLLYRGPLKFTAGPVQVANHCVQHTGRIAAWVRITHTTARTVQGPCRP